MGDVAIIFKIMPESPDVDLTALEATIREKIPTTQDVGAEPIGFGLSCLKVALLVPDGKGTSEEVEETLGGIEGVQSVEILSLTLT